VGGEAGTSAASLQAAATPLLQPKQNGTGVVGTSMLFLVRGYRSTEQPTLANFVTFFFFM